MHRKTSEKQNWRTPPYLFRAAELYVQRTGAGAFLLDAAADKVNALCEFYYTEADNALHQPWAPSTWVNPPFNQTLAFVRKAIQEATRGNTVCMLLTASTENKFFHEAWHSKVLHEVVFITGRVAFIHPDSLNPIKGNTAGSMLLIFRPQAEQNPVPPTINVVRRDDLKQHFTRSTAATTERLK